MCGQIMVSFHDGRVANAFQLLTRKLILHKQNVVVNYLLQLPLTLNLIWEPVPSWPKEVVGLKSRGLQPRYGPRLSRISLPSSPSGFILNFQPASHRNPPCNGFRLLSRLLAAQWWRPLTSRSTSQLEHELPPEANGSLRAHRGSRRLLGACASGYTQITPRVGRFSYLTQTNSLLSGSQVLT